MLTLLFLLSCGKTTATKSITDALAASTRPLKNKAKEYDRAKSEELRLLLDRLYSSQSEADFNNLMNDIKPLVSEGANPAQVSKHDATPLHYAVWANDAETIELLLKFAANKSELINHQSEDGETPLFVALERKEWGTAKLLLRDLALDEILYLFTDSDSKWTLIHEAAFRGEEDAVAFMKDVLADGFEAFAMIQDKDERTALHVAVDKGNVGFISKLFEILSPKSIKDLVMLQDSHGDTVLHIAARYEDDGLIKYILDNIVDVEARAQLEGVENSEGNDYKKYLPTNWMADKN